MNKLEIYCDLLDPDKSSEFAVPLKFIEALSRNFIISITTFRRENNERTISEWLAKARLNDVRVQYYDFVFSRPTGLRANKLLLILDTIWGQVRFFRSVPDTSVVAKIGMVHFLFNIVPLLFKRRRLILGPISGFELVNLKASFRHLRLRSWIYYVFMNAFILLGTVIFRGLLCFNKSVALICATSIDRRRILQWAHSSTRVFQVSEISIFFPEHVAPRKSNTVVWSGAMIPRKAPLLAVSIIAEVLRRSKDSDAIFIGDGELKNRTETAVAQLGSDIAQRIKFCGAVSPDMSRKVIASSSVLLVTSWREVNSFVVFEAMASNTKVVSMAISGMQDVVFMFGNVVDPNGSLIPEFADAVYHTLEDLVISDEQFKEVRAKVQRDEANEFQALIAWVEDGGIS